MMTPLVADHVPNISTELGLPEQIVSDNGPYYTGKEFQDMCKKLHIHQMTSNPHHHQSNGLAEKYVGIVNNLIAEAQETGQSIHMALPIYWNTSFSLSATIDSTMQLLFQGQTCTNLPISSLAKI